MMFHGLRVAVSKLLESDVGYIFDEFVVNDKVIDIHDKHIQHLFSLRVVPPHFIESRLRHQDVIH